MSYDFDLFVIAAGTGADNEQVEVVTHEVSPWQLSLIHI